MIPLVALLGRPNVGKSTLFNRLTKTCNSLVSDFPGLTRDRKYGFAKIDGYEFICIDTAGITNIETKAKISINKQVFIAIEEADVILFVVDARAGLIPVELEIVRYLHRYYKKTMFLVANKSDGVDINQVTTDFWPLKFERIYPVVASRGHGVSNLLRTALLPFVRKVNLSKTINKNTEVSLLSSLKNKENKKTESDVHFSKRGFPIKLAVIGRPNTGKSTLINRLLGEDRVIVYNEPGTTRDSIYIPMRYNEREYILIDTAGVRKRKRDVDLVERLSTIKSIRAIEEANVVFLVLDAKEGVLNQDFSLLWFILSSGSSLIIVVNKCDVLNQVSKERIKKTLNFRLGHINFVRIHFISALYDTEIEDLFESAIEAYNSSVRRVGSAMLTNIMNKAIENHQPPMARGKFHVKLKYAHPGGYNPPIVVIHGNRVKELSDSYKRYLENYFRKSLDIIGTLIHIQFKEGNNPYVKQHELPILKKRKNR